MDFYSDFRTIVDGKTVEAGNTYDVLNPATEEVIGKAPDITADGLNAAVRAARSAFPRWSAQSISVRRNALHTMADKITANADKLSRLLTLEQGKPVAQADNEVAGCALWLNVIADQELPITLVELEDRSSVTTRVPLGVVGAIAPWNFPLLLSIYKIAPALLTGNTVVVKPSPFTPLSTLKMVELLNDLLPPGVLNTVSGGGELGAAMSSHADINMISFTGSTATGKKIMASAASSLKRLTLELGGNDAAIVLPDVDVESAAKGVFWGAFFNSGQLCVAAKRVYVHQDIYAPFTKALADYANSIKVGDGLEQGTDLGPINNEMQYQHVKSLIDDSRAQGHKFLTGGDLPDGKGYFAPVTIVDNPPDTSRVVQEEAFGPVLPVLSFSSVDEVVDRANNTLLGLGGSVWSADPAKAQEVADRLQTGNVWINQNGTFHPSIPYATAKQSGIGVENGIEGLIAYTNAKTVVQPKV